MKIVECVTDESVMTPCRPSALSKADQLIHSLYQRQLQEENINIVQHVVDQVEEFGYSRDYIIRSLKQHDLNNATTSYLLLHFGKRGDGRDMNDENTATNNATALKLAQTN